MARDRRTTVLILSRSRRFRGGVMDHVAKLTRHAASDIRHWRMTVGQQRPGGSRLAKLFYPWRDNLRLARRIAAGRVDCVHLNPSLNLTALLRDGLFMITLSLLGHRRILVFMHGWDPRMAQRLARNPVWRWAFVTVFGRASAFVVLARRFKEALSDMGLPAARVHVQTTMFERTLFEGVTPHAPRTGRTLLFMSRFERAKGGFELLQAFAALRVTRPELRLVMAGDGPERRRLEGFVRREGLGDCVSFPGFIRGADKARALLEADLFVFPTYYGEGCPTVLLEAMAAGLPVVTTGAGGIGDVFTAGENGILLPAVTPAAIADAASLLLADRGLRARMGAANRTKAWREFEAGTVTARLEALYRAIVAGPGEHGAGGQALARGPRG